MSFGHFLMEVHNIEPHKTKTRHYISYVIVDLLATFVTNIQ